MFFRFARAYSRMDWVIYSRTGRYQGLHVFLPSRRSFFSWFLFKKNKKNVNVSETLQWELWRPRLKVFVRSRSNRNLPGSIGFWGEGSKDEKQQQTQPTYDTGTGSRTRATLDSNWIRWKTDSQTCSVCICPSPQWLSSAVIGNIRIQSGTWVFICISTLPLVRMLLTWNITLMFILKSIFQKLTPHTSSGKIIERYYILIYSLTCSRNPYHHLVVCIIDFISDMPVKNKWSVFN